jgi:hypothetical protein
MYSNNLEAKSPLTYFLKKQSQNWDHSFLTLSVRPFIITIFQPTIFKFWTGKQSVWKLIVRLVFWIHWCWLLSCSCSPSRPIVHLKKFSCLIQKAKNSIQTGYRTSSTHAKFGNKIWYIFVAPLLNAVCCVWWSFVLLKAKKPFFEQFAASVQQCHNVKLITDFPFKYNNEKR